MQKEVNNGEVVPRKVGRMKRTITIILWVIAWPVIVLGMMIPIASFATIVAGKPMQLGTYLGVISCCLVVFCWIAIKVLRRKSKEHPLRAIGGRVLSVYTIIGVALLAIGTYGTLNALTSQQVNSQQGQNVEVANNVSIPSLERNAEIDQSLRTIGAAEGEITKFSTTFVDTYPTVGKRGEYMSYVNPVTGAYLYGKMTILKGHASNEQLSTVAHEYLHHVWYAILDEPTKVRITSDLITMYGNDSPAKVRAQWYSDSQSLQPTELFSIYCTESTDQYLTDFVRDQCNRYINRSAFYMQR